MPSTWRCIRSHRLWAPFRHQSQIRVVTCASDPPAIDHITTPSPQVWLTHSSSSQNSEKHVTYWSMVIWGKATTREQPERRSAWGMWKGLQSCCAFSRCAALLSAHQPGKVWSPSLWVFLEASLHWPLVIALNHPWPSPPAICRGVGRTECSTLLLHGWFPLQPAPPQA